MDPAGIIDIGSNSVRLVVYAGPERVPTPIFNEKVMAGLGAGMGETDRLPEVGRRKALAALARFRLLLDHMKVKRAQVVATAAVRDAADGPDFIREVERMGLDCRVLSAEQEARFAGEGVISGIPDADGVVGDLGGGSLELVEVGDGRASCSSLRSRTRISRDVRAGAPSTWSAGRGVRWRASTCWPPTSPFRSRISTG